MRPRKQEDLAKLFKYSMRRWMTSRHLANYCATRGDLHVDFVRAERATDMWFAVAERVIRLYRSTIH